MPAEIVAALDRASSALEELDRRCCDVGRSPRLSALSAKLGEIRVAACQPDGVAPATVSGLLEDAGAMIGSLQVGCCAPNRLPLYATLLEQLNIVQRHVAPMH